MMKNTAAAVLVAAFTANATHALADADTNSPSAADDCVYQFIQDLAEGLADTGVSRLHFEIGPLKNACEQITGEQARQTRALDSITLNF